MRTVRRNKKSIIFQHIFVRVGVQIFWHSFWGSNRQNLAIPGNLNVLCQFLEKKYRDNYLKWPALFSKILARIKYQVKIWADFPRSWAILVDGQWVLKNIQYSSWARKKSPRRGIEPRSPAWQAGILTTILTRIRYGNDENWALQIVFQYHILWPFYELYLHICQIRNTKPI